MSAGAGEWRDAAAALLLDHGIPDAGVRAVGPDGEIALLSVPPDHWERLLGAGGAPLAREIKALGFRYVAIELA